MNNSVALVIIILTAIIWGYLSGSLCWSIIIGKFFYKKDLREFESGNAGATNSMRVYGKKTAAFVLILDVLKCYLPTMSLWLICRYVLNDYLIVTAGFNPYSLVYLTSLFAIVGHCYPIFFNFKGGKGVSTLGAFILCINPFMGLVLFIFFLSLIKITKYVSLSSMVTALICPFALFIPGFNWLYMLNIDISQIISLYDFGIYWMLFVSGIVLVAACFSIFLHRKNIYRLLNHTERKLQRKAK